MEVRSKILKMICNNTRLSTSLEYLESILEHEDYLIYFYCKEFAKGDNYKLTRESLKIALEEQKLYWVTSKSTYSLKYGKFPLEYLQSKVQTHLSDDITTANALVKLVLNKYDEIQKLDEVSIDEYNSIIKSERQYLQADIMKRLIKEITPILTGESESYVYKGVRYHSTDVLELFSKMASDKVLELNGMQVFSSKEQEHQNQLDSVATHFSSADSLFKWNLSRDTPFIKDLIAGNIVGVVGGEKAGKTKFTMGEIVYPALLNGKNVKIYSGEMDIEDLYASLVVKHLYSFYNYTFDSKEVRDIIVLSTKVRKKTATDKEIEYLNSMSRTVVELTLNALNYLKYSKHLGRLKLIRAGSEEAMKTKEFYMEYFERNNMNEIQNTEPKDRFDLVVLDHVNIFTSSEHMSLEKFIQAVVRTAKNSIQPFTAVLVNHLRSDDMNIITKKDFTVSDLENYKLSSHGTRELEKSATLTLLLVELKEQAKMGQICLKIGSARDFNVMNEYNTNVFKLVANREVSDFCLIGHSKPAYIEAK